MILRYPAVSGLALAMTFSLFFVMQLLVATGADVIQLREPLKPIIITRQIEDEAVLRKSPVLPLKEVQPQPPVVDTDPPIRMGKPGGRGVKISGVGVKEIAGPSGPISPSAANRDQAMAIVAIPPRYPTVMASRGIEGYVDIRFDISKTGAVRNPRVIYSTNRGFERSAMHAIDKWKFQPRVVDGVPQMQFGVEKRIKYVLEPS